MLSRSSRLPYREFRSNGYRTAITPFFTLKTRKSVTGENRLGIIIGVAAEKSAARRNFWKRHAKAVFKMLPDFPNDFLIIFSKNIKSATIKKFKEEFMHAAGIKIIA